MVNLRIGDQAIGINLPESRLNRAKLVLICGQGNDLPHLKRALERYGFIVKHTEDISSVEDICLLSTVDVIIVDGASLYSDTVSTIRRLLLVPDRAGILVRSGSNDDIDRIVALDMGADDCVDESCSAREISARAAAITRRSSVKSQIQRESGKLEFAGWELRSNTRQLLTPAKNMIHLTGTEYSVLRCLLSNPGSVKSRSDLRYYPDTGDGDDGDPRTMDVSVSRLRKKMMHHGDENIIETVRGFGYRLIT